MKKSKLKYSANYHPEFIRELRASVKEYFDKNKLSKFGNASLVTKSLVMTVLYLGPYVLMLLGIVQSVPLMLLCWLTMGLGMAGMGMVLMHDANHQSFSRNSILNNMLSKSIFLLGGFPATWRHQHNTLHHSFTNIEGHDEDISPIGLLRFSPHKPLMKIHKFQQFYAWFFYGLMTISWISAKDFLQISRYKKMDISFSKGKSFNRLLIELIASKLFYYLVFLIIPLLFFQVSWYWTVLFFFVMHFVGGLSLSIIFQTAHVVPSSKFPLPDDKGNVENSWAIHQLQTTSDYSPRSRVFSWLIGGLNYQVVHHLFPNISHVHYRKLSKIVKETTAKYELPYHVQSNFMMAVINHFRMLKTLGTS